MLEYVKSTFYKCRVEEDTSRRDTKPRNQTGKQAVCLLTTVKCLIVKKYNGQMCKRSYRLGENTR